jgi:hypothetical protein
MSKQLVISASLSTAMMISGSLASAEGIVSKIVNSPLSAAGLVTDARIGVNVYLQSNAATDAEFMNPEVVGYGLAPGGYVDIELGEGFERDSSVPITQKAIMVVTGAPQQGMPGKAVGYKVQEGDSPNVIRIKATKPGGLPAESLMTPAPGAKGDPIRQRGIKVFHIGLLQSAFVARGDSGTISVSFVDGNDKVQHFGQASVDFIESPVPQIQPNNFPDAQRNHNWQVTSSGSTLGQSPGTLPIPFMVYAADRSVPPAKLHQFKAGINGVGVLSTQQLKKMNFEKPDALSRYNGGLIIQDTSGDGRLDPMADKIIGGVIGKAPAGAKGQELKSLNVHGGANLSVPATAYHAKFGKVFGGSIGLLQFTAGNKPGLYRPTLALMADPNDPSKGDGSSYMYTIVVK